MGSYSVVLPLSILDLGLVKSFCTLGDGIVITGTLGDEGMSDSICGGGIGGGFYTLGYVCAFLSSAFCVKNSGCSVGDVVWAVGAWNLIKVLSAIASRSRSLVDVYTFTFGMPFVDCYRFRMALITRSECVVVGFVMCLCWDTTVSDTH